MNACQFTILGNSRYCILALGILYSKVKDHTKDANSIDA